MRDFLRRHSSVYQWAVRPSELTILHLNLENESLAREMEQLRADHERRVERLTSGYEDRVAMAAAANLRLRRINRDLVGKVREMGAPAAEYPARKCPACGSMAAVPEEGGKHSIGIVRYSGGTATLYCDGSES